MGRKKLKNKRKKHSLSFEDNKFELMQQRAAKKKLSVSRYLEEKALE